MKSKQTIKVAFPRRESPLKYDPANIQYAYEYIFLETIYSPLVEYDVNGKFRPGIAERFWWDNGRLMLQIRAGVRSVDGTEITAEDVAFSLKRVMILGANTHGNLADLLCHGHPIKTLDEKCRGLEVQGNTVILSPVKPNPFLISMLTGIDFAVLPRKSVDPKTLKILEMRNTSGPMYVERVDEAGIVLRRNPGHYNADPTRPAEIVLVPSVDPTTAKSKALEMFTAGQVDLLTTIDSTSAEDVVRYHMQHPSETSLHASLDIRIFMLRFSSRALGQFSERERFALGPALVGALREEFRDSQTLKPTDQIVPAYGEGSLDEARLSTAKQKSVAATPEDLGRPLRVYLMRLPDTERFKKAVLRVLPNAEFFDSNERSLPNWGDDSVDLMISGPDMGYVEDIALYSYALKAGIFRTREGADKWLATYMAIDEKEKRIALIRELHAYNLERGFAFPIFASPYVAMARQPWQITIPKMFANHPLWQTSYPR